MKGKNILFTFIWVLSTHLVAQIQHVAPHQTENNVISWNPDNSISSNSFSGTIPSIAGEAPCSNGMFLSYENNTRLVNIETSTNPFDYPPVGGPSGIRYNGIGFNPVDGKIYGFLHETRQLLQIDPVDGSYVNLGAVAGMPASTIFNSGEFDDLGNFYVKASGNNSRIYKIDVTALTSSPITLTGAAFNTSDFAYNIQTGLLYGVNDNGRLFSVNPNTGALTLIGAAGAGFPFGAMFASSLGDIYGISNSGAFYQFNLSTGQRVLISNAPSSSNHDGAHCVTEPILFSSDLSVTKTDGLSEYIPGTSTTYTVVVENHGPFGVLNASVTDIVPAGIPASNVSYTAVASAGSFTGVTGTQTGDINDLVSLPVGGTVTYTVTVNIPSNFTGNLVNTVTVTPPVNINDTDPDNNTATDTNVKLIEECSNNEPTVFYNGDNSGNRYGNTGSLGNLLPFVTVSNIAGGTFGETINTGQQLNTCPVIAGITYFHMSGVTGAVQTNKYYSFNITTATNSPILHFNRFNAMTPVIYTSGGAGVNQAKVNYHLRVAIVDPDTSNVINLGEMYVNSSNPANTNLDVDYQLQPGKNYEVRLYPWNSNGYTNVYLDNPRLFFTPIPVTTETTVTCLSDLSGTVGDALESYIVSDNPGGLQLRWLNNGTDVTDSPIEIGSYTPVYYNSSSDCYSDAGNPVTVIQCTSGSPCTQPGATGTALASSVGILTKGFEPSVNEWPETVPNGYLVIDAANKGMVITHMTTAQIEALIPLKGMIVYNTDLQCVQIYRGNDTDNLPNVDLDRFGWQCLERGCNE